MSEWIEVNLKWYQYDRVLDDEDNLIENNNLDSFESRGLNKPGTIVEMVDGKQYLIGDINKNRGICGECPAFDDQEIVKRYKVVWSKQ